MMSKLDLGVKTQMQQSELAFDYVITELLNQKLDGPIALSLLEYMGNTKDIQLVLDMSDNDIDDLHYFTQQVDTSSTSSKDEKGDITIVKRDLPKGFKRLVKILVSFHKHLRAEGVDIFFDWSNIDLESFTHYRQYTYDGNVTTPAPARLAKPEPKVEDTKSTTHRYSQAEQFKKSIKRDIAHFTVLKDKKQFKSWHQNLLATAAAQDVEDVLDPTYIPSNDEEIELFIEKQKYMYLVAMTILKTDRGIVFVGQHEVDRDAQQVFKKVINFYLHSRTADIDASAILKYITSAKLGEGTWKGTTVGFISHWQEQVRQYNKIVDNADVIGPTLMHTMLKTAVYGIEELRAVQNTADQLKIFTGHGQTYEEYCALLISAATSYDDHHKPKTFLSRRNTNNRKVYEHDLSYNDIDSWGDHGEFEEFNVHTDVQEIQAYATNF